MRSGIAFIALMGVAISAATLVSVKVGKSMSMQHNDTDAVIAQPTGDTYLSRTFETATFALG